MYLLCSLNIMDLIRKEGGRQIQKKKEGGKSNSKDAWNNNKVSYYYLPKIASYIKTSVYIYMDSLNENFLFCADVSLHKSHRLLNNKTLMQNMNTLWWCLI